MEEVERSRRLAELKRRLFGSDAVVLADRYLACPVCGQFYDVQDFTEVYYHDNEPHGPMKADA